MTKLGGIIMITKKSELSDAAIWAAPFSMVFESGGLNKENVYVYDIKPACVVL